MSSRVRASVRPPRLFRPHPLTQWGWRTARPGRSRSKIQTTFGIALIGTGLMINASQKRRILYRGTIKQGSETRIRVFRGNTIIHEQSIGG